MNGSYEPLNVTSASAASASQEDIEDKYNWSIILFPALISLYATVLARLVARHLSCQSFVSQDSYS